MLTYLYLGAGVLTAWLLVSWLDRRALQAMLAEEAREDAEEAQC